MQARLFQGRTRGLYTARLIVVDDQPAFRNGLRALLRGARGLEVVGEASNGREAVDLCGQLRPDLVILDLHLPDANGFTVARSIMNALPHIRIVVVTLDASPAYRTHAQKLGLHGFAVKGSGRRELLAVIRQSLLK